jgi:hypothetical protein
MRAIAISFAITPVKTGDTFATAQIRVAQPQTNVKRLLRSPVMARQHSALRLIFVTKTLLPVYPL